MISTVSRPESFRLFLWGYLKDKVHSRLFVSVEDLKERIKLHYSNINYDQLNSVMKNVKKLCMKCGLSFLLKKFFI